MNWRNPKLKDVNHGCLHPVRLPPNFHDLDFVALVRFHIRHAGQPAKEKGVNPGENSENHVNN